MSSMMGNKIRISIFGQSHGRAIGVTIDGLPAGEPIDLQEIQAFMARRAPGNSSISSSRSESDTPEILSGIALGKTCGAPLCAIIPNNDARSQDYSSTHDIPRPSHVDFTALAKHGSSCDLRGGGHFSGRLTAPLCFAGAVCKQILARRGIFCGAHISQIGNIFDDAFNATRCTKADLQAPSFSDFPTISAEKGKQMRALISDTAQQGNSIGGAIECAAIGVSAGFGNPMFDGVESLLSHAIFAIPGVRGVEFGSGFGAAAMQGSAHNDAFIIAENGQIQTETNNHGGILGGITSGMPIIVRAAFKPTPSIALPQKSVNLRTKTPETIEIQGRHDPCIVPRAVPCLESVTLLTLADLTL